VTARKLIAQRDRTAINPNRCLGNFATEMQWVDRDGAGHFSRWFLPCCAGCTIADIKRLRLPHNGGVIGDATILPWCASCAVVPAPERPGVQKLGSALAGPVARASLAPAQASPAVFETVVFLLHLGYGFVLLDLVPPTVVSAVVCRLHHFGDAA